MTPSAGLSRSETDQFTPLQLSLKPFCLVVNLWCKLDLKERTTANEIKLEPEQKQRVASVGVATASLISRCCLPQL